MAGVFSVSARSDMIECRNQAITLKTPVTGSLSDMAIFRQLSTGHCVERQSKA